MKGLFHAVACWMGLVGLTLVASQSQDCFDSPSTPPPLVQFSPPVLYDETDTAGSLVLEGMPTYIWLHGCAPTAAAMFLAYYDAHGFPYLFPGDAGVIPMGREETHYLDPRTESTIASPEHYANYSLPMDSGYWIMADRSTLGGAHEDNSVADYLRTSWSALMLSYGSTWPENLISGIKAFVLDRHPEAVVESSDLLAVTVDNLEESFELIVAEIQAGRPLIGSADSDGDGRIDHAIPIIGYHRAKSGNLVVCHDGWFHEPRTMEFRQVTVGFPFGIQALITFRIEAPDTIESLHRFHRLDNDSHFFTASEVERMRLEMHEPDFVYEKIVHPVFAGPELDGVVPVYRFSRRGGGHFYTAMESERESVIAHLSETYTYDGIAFYVYSGPVDGGLPVFRFFHPSTGSHFFTGDVAERDQLIVDRADSLLYEGIAWWAPSFSVNP